VERIGEEGERPGQKAPDEFDPGVGKRQAKNEEKPSTIHRSGVAMGVAVGFVA
jgi:hypothetical protein